MRLDWPSKEAREEWEIRSFVEHYRRLPERRAFEVVRKQERPDWILRDIATGERVGVELTSTYLHDRSVPDVHRGPEKVWIPDQPQDVAAYGCRIAEAVQKKIQLAQGGYKSGVPLLLSVYTNEYVTLYMDEEAWASLVREHESTFDNIVPFLEIVIWPLINGGVLRIRPGISWNVNTGSSA